MATVYSGFATRKMEEVYMSILRKVVNMLSLKLLHAEGKDLLTEDMIELVNDERSWTSKLFKLYYSMRKMEKRKYSGDGFTSEFR